MLERPKAGIALDPASRFDFVVGDVVVVRAHNEWQDLPDGGENNVFVTLAVGQFANLIDVDTLAGQVRLQCHLENCVVTDILYGIALAAGVGRDDAAKIADQLCGLLEVDIDCLVRFLLDVLGSNFQLPAQLCPKLIQIEIFREDSNEVHFLFASEFGPKLNPGKHGEIFARKFLQRPNTRNINHVVVGDRDDTDARFLEPLNNFLIRDRPIFIVEGSRRVEVQIPPSPKRTTVMKWHEHLPLCKAPAPKATCLVREASSIDSPSMQLLSTASPIAQMILAFRDTDLYSLRSAKAVPMEGKAFSNKKRACVR